ncbi:MAG: DUF262 domain-containing protein [Dietzia maris]
MVNAQERGLNQILQGPWQYQVPLYQRPYQWKESNRAQLWEDVVQLADERQMDPTASHFLGSLVLSPAPGAAAGGVQRFLVVDGQQRLTTLTLLLAAIRDHHEATGELRKAEAVNELYLINKFESDALRLKLLPTQADREAYAAVIERLPEAGGDDPVGETYRFFRRKLIAADDPEDPHDIDRIEAACTQGVSLVVVTTDANDNVHRIFESLNNTGLQLSQADLLRNYLFMRLPTRAEEVYKYQWKPLQDALTTEELEVLFWFDLVRHRPTVKQGDTYTLQQRRLDAIEGEAAIAAEVERLSALGKLLRVVTHPEEEVDEAVRIRLRRLHQWDSSTVLPVMLYFLDKRAKGEADSATVARAMLAIESYLVRRLVMGRSSSNVNRTLLGVVAESEPGRPLDESVLEYLSTGRKHFATDAEIREAVALSPFYIKGRANHRALVMKWIEATYQSKEAVDLSQTTIEHIMPQTLSEAWKSDLEALIVSDETVTDVHTRLLHTLGNLTLTGYNTPLGNRPFSQKKTEFARSGIRLNHFPAHADAWGPTQIAARAEEIAEKVISAWPGPVARPQDDTSSLWRALDQVAASIPAGHWTTYGDIASAVGTHPVPLAQRLASHPVPNAYRILTADGSVSPGFAWIDPRDERDVHDVLASEGVEFDDKGRADTSLRLFVDDLVEGTEDRVDGGWPTDVDTAVRRVRSELRGLGRRALFRNGVLTPTELATWVVTGQPEPAGRDPRWSPTTRTTPASPYAERLRKSAFAHEAIALLHAYVSAFLPRPELMEATHWSVSAPARASTLWTVYAGGYFVADVTISDDGPLIRLWVARSPMLADGANSLLAELIGESVQVTDSGFTSLSDDQTTLHIHDLRTAKELLADPALGTAIRLHNARLVTMKNAREAEHIPEFLDGAW